jgi:hypothetical protein
MSQHLEIIYQVCRDSTWVDVIKVFKLTDEEYVRRLTKVYKKSSRCGNIHRRYRKSGTNALTKVSTLTLMSVLCREEDIPIKVQFTVKEKKEG